VNLGIYCHHDFQPPIQPMPFRNGTGRRVVI